MEKFGDCIGIDCGNLSMDVGIMLGMREGEVNSGRGWCDSFVDEVVTELVVSVSFLAKGKEDSLNTTFRDMIFPVGLRHLYPL